MKKVNLVVKKPVGTKKLNIVLKGKNPKPTTGRYA